jgi:hypothetical protein
MTVKNVRVSSLACEGLKDFRKRPDWLCSPPSLPYKGCGVKRTGREIDQSPPPSVEVTNNWSYTSTPRTRLNGLYCAEHQIRVWLMRTALRAFTPVTMCTIAVTAWQYVLTTQCVYCVVFRMILKTVITTPYDFKQVLFFMLTVKNELNTRTCTYINTHTHTHTHTHSYSCQLTSNKSQYYNNFNMDINSIMWSNLH